MPSKPKTARRKHSSETAAVISSLCTRNLGKFFAPWINILLKWPIIMPHTCSCWVLTYSTSRWSQRRFFQDLSITFHARLFHTMAFNSYSAIEGQISEACDAIHNGWYTNCVQAASAYEVPLRRLQRRWNGGASKSTRAPTNKALTEEQEDAIREYINRLDKINMCARLQMIVGAVNYLICFENRVVGHQWLKRFFERNPEYHIRKQKPLATERKHSHSVHDMSDYFEKIERVMREKGITE